MNDMSKSLEERIAGLEHDRDHLGKSLDHINEQLIDFKKEVFRKLDELQEEMVRYIAGRLDWKVTIIISTLTGMVSWLATLHFGA